MIRRKTILSPGRGSPIHVATLTAGLGSMTLGFVVVWGWLTRNSSLIQVNPSFVPMQMNTAIGFVLCGISLVFLGLRRDLPAKLCALSVSLLGLVTLAEYVFGLNLGIDQLFLKHYITVQTSHPGRMAPNTAVSFFLSGAAVILATWHRWPRGRFLLSELMGALALALGALSVLGYLIGLEVGYGWGEMTRMAVHTGAGFIVLGMGIFAFAWIEGAATVSGGSHWLALPLGLAIAAMAVVLWRGLVVEQHAKLTGAVEFQADDLALGIEDLLRSRLQGLERMARRWERRGGTPREEWQADADRYVRDWRDYLAVAWVDTARVVRWAATRTEFDRIALSGLPIESLDRARERRSTTVSRSRSIGTGEEEGFYTVVPLYVDGGLDGYLVGATSIPRMIGSLAETARRRGYSVSLVEGEKEIFRSSGLDGRDGPGREFLVQRPTKTREFGWRLRAWPTTELLGRSQSPLPGSVLVMGLLLAILFPATVKLAVGHEYRADLFQRANFDPLTRLPNRALAADRFAQAVARARRTGQHVALLFLDLDGFKQVNDTLGHLVGDHVLREVAGRLEDILRETDTVARLGGDEFLLLLPDLATKSVLEPVCARILEAFAAPFEVDGRVHRVTASIGIALFPDDGDNLEVLLRWADAAMYRAKAEGGGRYFMRAGDGGARAAPPVETPTTDPRAEEALVDLS